MYCPPKPCGWRAEWWSVIARGTGRVVCAGSRTFSRHDARETGTRRTAAHATAAKRLEDKDSAAAKILAVEPILEANFSTTAALRQKQTKARRWAPNPEEHWGPKAAARGKKKKAR